MVTSRPGTICHIELKIICFDYLRQRQIGSLEVLNKYWDAKQFNGYVVFRIEVKLVHLTTIESAKQFHISSFGFPSKGE